MLIAKRGLTAARLAAPVHLTAPLKAVLRIAVQLTKTRKKRERRGKNRGGSRKNPSIQKKRAKTKRDKIFAVFATPNFM